MYVGEVDEAKGVELLPLNQLYVRLVVRECDDDALNTMLVPSHTILSFTESNGFGKSSWITSNGAESADSQPFASITDAL